MAATNQVFLSIILPFLDAESDIKDSFTCLAEQVNVDKKSIEVIVVNDGSKDGTAKELEKQSVLLKDFHSFRVIEHAERQGHTITRIDGANAAKGKFLTFIDKKCRPDKDYLYSFISKNRNIIIGNPYVKKERSLWGRVLALIRIRLYYPYFNHPFDDIDLDHDAYAKFKNKGGGGSMYVLKKYYLEVAKTMPTGVHVNDDSLFVLKLAEIEPILKTASAKIEYINRTGFLENIVHLYNRGPKFVDFYAHPGTRFFPPIVALVVFLILNVVLIFVQPYILLYELIAFIIILAGVSLYLAEGVKDFFVSVALIPIALVSFSTGIIKGLFLKLLHRY